MMKPPPPIKLKSALKKIGPVQRSPIQTKESQPIPPVAQGRNSGFPSLVPNQIPPLKDQETDKPSSIKDYTKITYVDDSDTSDTSPEMPPRMPLLPNVIELTSGHSSTSDSYYWDPRGIDSLRTPRKSLVTFRDPVGSSTPFRVRSSTDTESDDLNGTYTKGRASKRWAGLPVISELLSSFQDIEKEELVEPPTFDTEKSIADTIPNELYYPGISDVSDDLNLSIHTSNENLTYFRDNYLHFIPADCELTTIVSRLLIDTDKIDPQDLKLKKPKLNQILITNNELLDNNTAIIKDKNNKRSLKHIDKLKICNTRKSYSDTSD
ncbi:hypothetical protein KQX54_011200 [Cotesia glomerata]|uniref:Uncharacterized protein n=1 Tax=Cotesia glomerata TaxID=32391 RepID=A0AAV7IJ63_COTGL|nr:hypothetical protein KQX54_011200 [Cotesia glomerata]